MSQELWIRPAEAADLPEILNLMSLSLGSAIPRTRDFWSWKHEQNPFGPSTVVLGFINETLVGLRAFMRWTWQAASVELAAMRAVDTATHPSFQGRGVFRRLTLQALSVARRDGVRFVFNTPNHKSRPGYLKMGWSTAGRPMIWIRPISMRRDTIAEWDAPRASSVLAQDVDAGPRREHGNRDARLRTKQQKGYLHWRYARIPGITYHAFGDPREAFAIVRRKQTKGGWELRICELWLGDARQSNRWAEDLVRSMVSSCGCNYASCMAPLRTREAGVLLRCGFLPVPALGRVVTVHEVIPGREVLRPTRVSSYRFSIGDLELF